MHSDEIASLWHDGIKILFVTDGTLRIHYYTPKFDGAIPVVKQNSLYVISRCEKRGPDDDFCRGNYRNGITVMLLPCYKKLAGRIGFLGEKREEIYRKHDRKIKIDQRLISNDLPLDIYLGS